MDGFENECELSELKAKINEQVTVQWTVTLRGGSILPAQPNSYNTNTINYFIGSFAVNVKL